MVWTKSNTDKSIRSWGPRLSLVCSTRPSPDGLEQSCFNWYCHKTQDGGVGGTGHSEYRENCRGGDWRGSRRSGLPPKHSFLLAGRQWLDKRVGQEILSPHSSMWNLIYLDSLLMTLMRAPFSSFSLWLSDFSSVNTCSDRGKRMLEPGVTASSLSPKDDMPLNLSIYWVGN